MPIGIEEVIIAHEGIQLSQILAKRISRLANSGPVGYGKAVELVQKIAMSKNGMKALKAATRTAASYIFQHDQSNLQFLQARSSRGGSAKHVPTGSVVALSATGGGKKLSTTAARKIVNQFVRS